MRFGFNRDGLWRVGETVPKKKRKKNQKLDYIRWVGAGRWLKPILGSVLKSSRRVYSTVWHRVLTFRFEEEEGTFPKRIRSSYYRPRPAISSHGDGSHNLFLSSWSNCYKNFWRNGWQKKEREREQKWESKGLERRTARRTKERNTHNAIANELRFASISLGNNWQPVCSRRTKKKTKRTRISDSQVGTYGLGLHTCRSFAFCIRWSVRELVVCWCASLHVISHLLVKWFGSFISFSLRVSWFSRAPHRHFMPLLVTGNWESVCARAKPEPDIILCNST